MCSNHYKEHRDRTVLGFWVYLMSDCIIFAILFTIYTVLYKSTANKLVIKDTLQLSTVVLETVILLISSISCNMSIIDIAKNKARRTVMWLVLTFILGLSFIILEFNELQNLINQGYNPTNSSFFSSFFTLIGTHGLHVIAGLIWIVSLIYQIGNKNFISVIYTRVFCLNLFWHILDILWICIFSIVYLEG